MLAFARTLFAFVNDPVSGIGTGRERESDEGDECCQASPSATGPQPNWSAGLPTRSPFAWEQGGRYATARRACKRGKSLGTMRRSLSAPTRCRSGEPRSFEWGGGALGPFGFPKFVQAQEVFLHGSVTVFWRAVPRNSYRTDRQRAMARKTENPKLKAQSSGAAPRSFYGGA